MPAPIRIWHLAIRGEHSPEVLDHKRFASRAEADAALVAYLAYHKGYSGADVARVVELVEVRKADSAQASAMAAAVESARAEILSLLASRDQPMATAWIQKRTGLLATTLARRLAELVAEGRVCRGKRGVAFVYSIPKAGV